VIASPVVSNGIVVATAANPGGAGLGRVIAVRGNGKNDVSESHRLWDYSQSTPDSSTPVALGGRVYLLSDNGIVSSLDIKTGQRKWRKRLSKGPYHASLVAGDGKIYCLSSTGTCDVIKTSASGETLATNQLEGSFYATPAISGGTLYLRAYERIYAIDGD
jgi:outer membrane protein assembly factor BamB